MEYLVADEKYLISYAQLKELYQEYCAISDEEFIKKLPEITHFACVVGWFKELPNDATIGDKGIVHELIHLMHIPAEPLVNLKEIRASFKLLLKLD